MSPSVAVAGSNKTSRRRRQRKSTMESDADGSIPETTFDGSASLSTSCELCIFKAVEPKVPYGF